MPKKDEFQQENFLLVPLRDLVVYPSMVVPLFVGRERSVKALEYVISNNKQIVLTTQRKFEIEIPKLKDLYTVGVIASVLHFIKLPDGTAKVLVECKERALIKDLTENEDFLSVVVEIKKDIYLNEKTLEASVSLVLESFEKYTKLSNKIDTETLSSLKTLNSPSRLCDTIVSHLNLDITEKQDLLATINVTERLEKIFKFIEKEVEILNTEKKIRSNIKSQMEKTQKEYYLNEQLKAIHKELGDNFDEINNLEALTSKNKLSKEAKEKALAEIKKLKAMTPMSAEATVIRNYLDWLLNIPWNKRSKIKNDLKLAEKTLNANHYGLNKVKERILEYLAVQQRTKNSNKAPVLCLIGPPGVGKTSLAKSIANAIGRKFSKISLGGVRDEAEIRGHRRTYIGSMPGKIVQSMRKSESSNPLILLDELDKIGLDFRGDPASALLEVLDPEQNAHFNDHYLEVDYDLSKVMFVATANSMNIPSPLLDRLEIIHVSGYTEQEKIQIANNYLIPKILKDHAVKKSELTIEESAIIGLIRYFTREAGVRSLERELSKISRKFVRQSIMDKTKKLNITDKNFEKYAGVYRYTYGVTERNDLTGIVNGLAYTEFGGDILTIEAVRLPGKGNIKATGKLGEIMQESAQAAYSYTKSRCLDYGVTPTEYQEYDIHIHVPEGATPKDGPSAGAAMSTVIVSIMTGIPILKTVAMTGEITLRGRVLPIGGLKEKLLAALRGGVKTVLIPSENKKDMEEIPQNVKEGLKFVFVSNLDDVLKVALKKPLKPIKEDPKKEKKDSKKSKKQQD